MSPQPRHARLPGRLVKLRHQRQSHAAPGSITRDKKLVDIARRLQVGKARHDAIPFSHPRPVGAQTLGPLRGVVVRRRPGLQLRGAVVLAGELVNGGMQDGPQGGRVVGLERADVHGAE